MGVGRALYVLLFPLVFTAAGFVLALITFFSGYHKATGLKNVHFLTLDLSNLSLNGKSLIGDLAGTSISKVYTVATNGYCYGSSVNNLEGCKTPYEPFYFNIEELLNMLGIGKFYEYIANDVKDYNNISKAATYAAWVFFLVTIVLSFLQFVCGVFTMCSHVAGSVADFFATLSFITSVLGAAIVTGVYYEYSKKLGDLTSNLGIAANMDKAGLGFAWATAAALLIANVTFIMASCCCTTTRTRYVQVPEKAGYPY